MQERATLAEKRAAYVTALHEAVRRITTKLSRLDGVQRVSLFGSYARGRADLFTDLDVLVVMETDKPFLERLQFLYRHVAVGVDLDLLCYTPEEFRAMSESPFLRRLLENEVVLYETKPA